MPFEFEEEAGELGLGLHDVEIVEAVAGVNRNSGNPNLRVTFEDDRGAQLTEWLTHVPAARWRWEQLWFAAGLEFPPGGGTVDEENLLGRRVQVNVVDELYDGQLRRKVKEFLPADTSDIPSDVPADEDDSEREF
jgi:hypothetical protein